MVFIFKKFFTTVKMYSKNNFYNYLEREKIYTLRTDFLAMFLIHQRQFLLSKYHKTDPNLKSFSPSRDSSTSRIGLPEILFLLWLGLCHHVEKKSLIFQVYYFLSFFFYFCFFILGLVNAWNKTNTKMTKLYNNASYKNITKNNNNFIYYTVYVRRHMRSHVHVQAQMQNYLHNLNFACAVC